MDVTEKNGQPTMDEILASIRRLIAEEPMPAAAHIDFNARPILVNGEAEDVAEFDLPAIFRSSAAPQPEKAAPLFNRLSDAIRSATGHGTVIDASAESAAAPQNTVPDERGLSSLKVPSGAQSGGSQGASPHGGHLGPDTAPEAPAAPDPGGAGEAAATSVAEAGVARVMAPFKDRTFFKLAAGGEPLPRAVVPETPPGPPPAPAAPEVRVSAPPALLAAPNAVIIPAAPLVAVDFGAIIPSRYERDGDVRPASPVPAAPAAAETAADSIAKPSPMAADAPDATAAPSAEPEPTASLEDTTADLLRPMLRQWLADNMPRMVEKALHIEVAQSLKGVKHPGK